MSDPDTTPPTNSPLIVIASNRGPFKFIQEEDGSFSSRRGAGGLVTALGAVAAHFDVLWVASALDADDVAWAEAHQDTVQRVEDIDMRLVISDSQSYDQYYNVIANPLLWFIQHQLWDTPRYPSIDAPTWDAWHSGYETVNKQFAEAIADSVRQVTADTPDRPVIIFPQDYHLYLVPYYLRELLGFGVQIQPFVHIPWPGPDAWRMLPPSMRITLIHSLLMSDRVGFQTRRDAFNFVQSARFFLDDAHSYGARDSIVYQGRKVGAKAYPISVDVDQVDEIVASPQARLHKEQIINMIGDRKLILRIDRIEPSKNILRGLQAYRALLESHPEHRGRVKMLSLLVPSRMSVDEYQDYLREVMAESGMINANFSDEFWEPSRIIVGNNYPRALAAMQLYDLLLVNPIADGMNLVAKEGVLVNQRNGVLLLSEHAGAYYELGEHALSVSPFDIFSTAEAMHAALTIPEADRHRRAEALSAIVRQGGVTTWFRDQVDDSLSALSSHDSSASTPDTPDTVKSDDSSTAAGVESDSTPTATP